MHFRAAGAVRVTLHRPRLQPCQAPDSTGTHPVVPGVQAAPNVRTPHAGPFPAVVCAIGIELRDHDQLPAVPLIPLSLGRVNPARHLALHWEPAEKPGPLARRAIFPHGKARRGRRLAPSIDNNFSKPIWDNNLLAHVSRCLFDSLIRFPQSGRQAVWESRLPPA